MKGLKFLSVFLLVFVMFSCSARIEGLVREGGSAEISVRASLEPRTLSLLRSLRGFMGDERNTPVLNGETISRSMAAAPGIRSASFRNIGQEEIDGGISISHIGGFLSPGDSSFITYTENEGINSVVMVLDMESAPKIIAMLSPEVEEYLSALMAPAVLGDVMTKQEYLDAVASIYGRPLSDEISTARIRAVIGFPRQIISVQGGTSRERRAEFDIPLLDVLVLEEPIRFEITW